MFKQSGMKIAAACAAWALGLGVATTTQAEYFADNFNSYTTGNFSTNTFTSGGSGSGGPFTTQSDNWVSAGGAGNPKFTVDRYDYPADWDGSAALVYQSNDESAFSNIAGGHGINFNDAKTNDGASRVLTTTWTVATAGNPGDGSGAVTASFDFIAHNVQPHTSASGTVPFADTDNSNYYARFFDSAQVGTTPANAGFWLFFARETEANFTMSFFKGGTNTNLATSADAASASTFNYETWYHVEIAFTVDGTFAGNKAIITVTPYGGSAATLYEVGTSNNSLTFRDSGATGNTLRIDSMTIGTNGSATPVGNFTLDNVLVIPEPASMGLMMAGSLLVLVRRR